MSLQIASSEVYATCCSIKQYLDAPERYQVKGYMISIGY